MKQDFGKLLGNNDMAKIGCHDCAGCSSCCRGMGDSIWVDPYDAYRLTTGLHCAFEKLLEGKIELHVEDGLILPNLRMVGEGESSCAFLNDEGRCSIHPLRPGFCRLFPLGRNYEDGKLAYFVLEEACPAPNKTKVKINKWLNTPNLKAYEVFLVEWHALTKRLRAFFADNADNEAVGKAVNMKFLEVFYFAPYEEEDFYTQFSNRMQEMQGFLKVLGI